MSNNRYLEIDSTHRDRTRFPKPGYFEIPISQSGRKTITDAVDPVCLSTPILSWTSNNLSTSIPNVNRLTCIVEPKTTQLSGSTNTNTFIFNTTTGFRLHQKDDYYKGLICEDVAFLNRRRIKEYKFMGSFGSYDRGIITVEINFPETFVPTNQFYIYDPTDLSNPDYAYFFAPCSTEFFHNTFNNYLLYNETLNDFRRINDYDSTIHCLLIKNGNIPSWDYNHNYSIRKESPYIPLINGTNPIILNSTLSTIEVDVDLSNETDLINKFIRVLPTEYNYYSPDLADNESRRITAYNPSTNVISVFPPFTAIPVVNRKVEILSFSYDNLNPFVYTGSLLSQQELVCYEIELLSLVLPTEILSVGHGGYITSYQFVYVELSNTCSMGTRNIIYSNNPNSTKTLFKVPLFDIQDPPYFIKVGGGMTQTIKFKPNDTLLFSVTLGNGEIFDTVIEEKFSPEKPEPRIQISALFGMRRIV
jgi:hypothetical protein